MAGVPIDVWVRGICSLKPGVEGLSETIRVRSVLGRYLEHSRIFSFENNGEPITYIGSSDMMHRNLDRRVETLVRLKRASHIRELSELFELAMSDKTASWHLDPIGVWHRRAYAKDGSPLTDLQSAVMQQLSHRKRTTR